MEHEGTMLSSYPDQPNHVTQTQESQLQDTDSESSSDEAEVTTVKDATSTTAKKIPEELKPENNGGKQLLMVPTNDADGIVGATDASTGKQAMLDGDDSSSESENEEEVLKPAATKLAVNSFVGNKQEVDLNFSDDEDSEDEEDSGRKSKYPIKITRVMSEGGISGFVFHLTGFADKKMGDILWGRNKTKKYSKFLKVIGAAPWVCKVLEKGSTTEYVKNNKGWPLRGVAVVSASGTKPEKEAIIDWFDNVFFKAFQAINEKEKDKLKEYALPGIDDEETWYNDVTNWQEAVAEQEALEAIVTRNLQLNNGPKMRVFLNQSSENIYSLYPHGCLPKLIYKTYGIRSELLHDLDKKKLVKGKKKKTPPAAA